MSKQNENENEGSSKFTNEKITITTVN